MTVSVCLSVGIGALPLYECMFNQFSVFKFLQAKSVCLCLALLQVIAELDLVDEEDKITHEIDLLADDLKGEETLNIFHPQDPHVSASQTTKYQQQ